MSSDQVVSEVASAAENSSTKRSLDSECKKTNALPENATSSIESNDVVNPSKRIKLEAAGEGAAAATAAAVAPLNPVDTNGSTPSQPTNNIKRENGDTRANITESDSVAPADTSTDTADTGIEEADDESQRGKTSSVSISAPSPAVTRSRRSTSTEKKNGEEVMNSIKEELGDLEASDKPKARWRGKTNLKMSSRLK